ncbi:MAG: helix-turn-helix transcriptional regulator, partial [Nocardioides sp.]|nr:helix-turn-helix transcriptional regulator [Nocardioides sp.]
MSRPTKVLVTSEHEVVCSGLTTLLDAHPGFTTLIGSVDILLLEGADVVLYDVQGLLDSDGSELDRLVKENDVAVLAVTRDLRPELADRALEKGV